VQELLYQIQAIFYEVAVSNTSNYGDKERVLGNLKIVVARGEYDII
jgi:hypothetical protein